MHSLAKERKISFPIQNAPFCIPLKSEEGAFSKYFYANKWYLRRRQIMLFKLGGSIAEMQLETVAEGFGVPKAGHGGHLADGNSLS